MNIFEKLSSSPGNPNPWKKEEEEKKDKKQEKPKDSEKPGEGPSRREFLKFGLAAGATVVAGGMGKVLYEKMSEPGSKIRSEIEQEKAEEAIQSKEMEKIEEEESQAINEIFKLENIHDEIEINLDTIEATKKYWRQQYSGRLRGDLEGAFEKMSYWSKHLKGIFREVGVPEEYIYLAIPESHFVMRDISEAGAEGPYQFMPDTAGDYDLKILSGYDERHDPLMSGRACAEYLKVLKNRFGDWDLAMSAYNGGYANRYRDSGVGRSLSYKDFLSYAQIRINMKREEIIAAEDYAYEVKSRDDLSKIARRFAIDIKDLKNRNPKLIGRPLKIGENVVVPLQNDQACRAAIVAEIQGWKENLNYPAKFNAVLELIGELNLKDRFSDKEIGWKEVHVSAQTIDYKVQKRDSLSKIRKKVAQIAGVDLSLVGSDKTILAYNNLRSDRLKIGQELKIPVRKFPLRLKDIRPSYRGIKFLNPAIEASSVIPLGATVRIPAPDNIEILDKAVKVYDERTPKKG